MHTLHSIVSKVPKPSAMQPSTVQIPKLASQLSTRPRSLAVTLLRKHFLGVAPPPHRPSEATSSPSCSYNG